MQHQNLATIKRKRRILGGSFETDGTNAVVNALGDGTPARTATAGTFTITLDRNYGVMESGIAVMSTNTGDQISRAPTYSNASGVTVLTITDIDISSAAVA